MHIFHIIYCQEIADVKEMFQANMDKRNGQHHNLSFNTIILTIFNDDFLCIFIYNIY